MPSRPRCTRSILADWHCRPHCLPLLHCRLHRMSHLPFALPLRTITCLPSPARLSSSRNTRAQPMVSPPVLCNDDRRHLVPVKHRVAPRHHLSRPSLGPLGSGDGGGGGGRVEGAALQNALAPPPPPPPPLPTLPPTHRAVAAGRGGGRRCIHTHPPVQSVAGGRPANGSRDRLVQ